MKIRVIPAGIEDKSTLEDIQFRSKKSNGYSDAEMELFIPDLLIPDSWFARYKVFKVMLEDVIVGLLCIKLYKKRAMIEALFIDPSLQGKGIGKEVLTFAIKFCSDNGKTTIGLTSDPNSDQFYIKQGFVKTGIWKSKVIEGRTLNRYKYSL